jgi:integrase
LSRHSSSAAAKGWRADAGSAVRKGGLRSAPAVTLHDAWAAWADAAERGEVLSRHRRTYKPSTLRGYRAAMDDHVLPDLGGLRLGDVTADDLQALVDRLVGSGASGSTIRNTVVPCQALYRKHRRQLMVDPTDGLDLPEPGGGRERVASPAEAARLLEALRHDDRALWATATYAGLRRGELRALRVSDVGADSITVEGGLGRLRGADRPEVEGRRAHGATTQDAAGDPR